MLTRGSLTFAIVAFAGVLGGCASESRPDAAGGHLEGAPDGLGNFTRILPDSKLPEANAGVRSLAALAKEGGIVLVVTAPTRKNGDAQQGWSEQLMATHPGGKARLVFVEDFGPSWFPDTALTRIREEANPAHDPVMLIDKDGKVRKALAAPEDATVVLVYRTNLSLALVIDGKPSRSAAETAWRALSSTP